MFATLAGGYPLVDPTAAPLPGPDLDAAVRAVIVEQAEAGLGLLTDGGLRLPAPIEVFGTALGGGSATAAHVSWPGPITVEAWSFAASSSEEFAGGLPVKQCVPGPYTLARRLTARGREQATGPAEADRATGRAEAGGAIRAEETDRAAGPAEADGATGPAEADRAALTLALADALAQELEALAEAGCPFIQVDEDDAVAIGTNEDERALFREAQALLMARLDGTDRPHLSLAVSGGDADAAGPETIFAAPYDSHLFDLLAGPENWRLIRWAPPERGIVVGVADARTPRRDKLELIVWAVGYAASTGGRGEARIGVAPSGSLAGLPRAAARHKIELLGRAAELFAKRDVEPIAASLDPRAVDARSAGLGRWTPAREGPTRSTKGRRGRKG